MPSRLRSVLAVALAAAVTLSGSLVGVQSAAAASGDYIDWGVKSSFRSYIGGSIAKGTIDVAGGVTTNSDGSYRWPATASSYNSTTKVVTLTSAGSVHFSGHGGALDLTFSNISLAVELDGDSRLSGSVTSTTTSGTVVDYGTIAIADLDADRGERAVGDDTLDWNGIPATLTAAGAPAFGGFYAAGVTLDTVGLHISGDWPAESDGDGLTAEATPALVQTAEVEAGMLPTYVIPDEKRGIITVLSEGVTSTTGCIAHNVAPVYAECIRASTRIAYANNSQLTATVVNASTGAVVRTFDITSSRVSAGFGYYTNQAAVLDESTGDIFVRGLNIGLLQIPADATSVADVVTVQGPGFTGYSYLAFDQTAKRLYFAESSAGVYSFTKVAGTWTQEHLFSDGFAAAPNYLTVDQTTGDVYLYDAGNSSPSTRALLRVTGFRDGTPVLQAKTISLTSAVTSGEYYSGIASDPTTGTVYALISQGSPAINEIVAVADGAVIARETLPDYSTSLTVDAAGRVYAISKDSKRITAFDGRAIADGSIPTLVDTVFAAGTTFPVAAAGIGDRVYLAVSGPAPTAITVANKMSVDAYRAQKVAHSAYIYDWFESATVRTQPADVAVALDGAERLADGSLVNATPASVSFSASATANPAPSVRWQSRSAYGWTDLADGDGVSGSATGTLTISAGAEDDGSRYRAVFRNTATDAAKASVEIGRVASKVATLTVTVTEPAVETGGTDPTTTTPPGPTTAGTFEGVTLEWTGNPEMQAQPPAGGSNYFSAGASNGTQADYRATDGSVSIVQRTAAGAESAATWATKAAHLTGGSQVVRVGGGTAVVAADGSGTIAWTGAWSVNFYGGMIPFTLRDPVLTVASNGTGTLTADVSGYAGDMGDLTKKTALATVPDVVVATFANVAINSTTGVIVTPNYAGVAVTIPSTSTQQNRTVSGWGAWPQSWVDFQVATGLSSYWYSSGGSADSKKAPSAFAIGFAGAAVPVVPATATKPGTNGTTDDDTDDDTTSDGKNDTKVVTPAQAGSLIWGVKSSFRSYITGPIAKGAITLGDGAKLSGGAYWFGQAKGGTYSVKKGTGSTAYSGSVHFTGHAGLLDLTFSDPVVRVTSATEATLSVRINGGSSVALGAIDLSKAKKTSAKGSVAYSSAPVSLTSAGVAAFSYNGSGFYGVGQSMDPVSFVIGSTAKAGSTDTTTVSTFTDETWTPPTEPTATEGAEFVDLLDEPHAGNAVTVTASGFEANETGIKVVVYSDPIVLDTAATADAAGVVSWSGILPMSLEPGEHTLTFSGSVDRGIVFTVAEAEDLAGCVVTSASITWGFKESFRSYISGSIANGEWTPSDGATYETPNFGWATATGTYDPETHSGLVSFTGSVRFTGHDGLLDTTIANPQILFVDESTAYLLLDVVGVTMDDALAGNDDVQVDEGVSFVKLDLAGGSVELDGSTLVATDVPTSITDEGFAAFPNYEPGTEFDPISFELETATECAVVAEEPTDEPTSAPSDSVVQVEQGGFPVWVFWIGGAVLALLIALVVVIAVRRRRTV
jgi:hypothetical protein